MLKELQRLAEIAEAANLKHRIEQEKADKLREKQRADKEDKQFKEEMKRIISCIDNQLFIAAEQGKRAYEYNLSRHPKYSSKYEKALMEHYKELKPYVDYREDYSGGMGITYSTYNVIVFNW